jgi:chromosome segregation ATPase
MLFQRKNENFEIKKMIPVNKTYESFVCPFWESLDTKKKEAEQQATILANQFTTLKIEHERLTQQLQNITQEKSQLISKSNYLSQELLTIQENLQNLQKKYETKKKKSEELKKTNGIQNTQLMNIETNRNNATKNLSKYQTLIQKMKEHENKETLSDTTKKMITNIRERLETTAELDEIFLPGALVISTEIAEILLATITQIQKPKGDFLTDADTQVNAVKSQIHSNDSCDDRIPLHFLKIGEIILDKAHDYIKENKAELALVSHYACLEVLNAIKILYEDQTFRIQLSVLRGRRT